MGRSAGRARSMWLALLVVAAALPGAAMAQEVVPGGAVGERPTFGGFPSDRDREVVPGQIIVKYDEGVGATARAAVRSEENLAKKNDLELINADVVKVEGRSVEEAINDLEDDPAVAYAVPDRVVHPMGYADEERFDELWGLRNTGQEIKGRAGRPDADVDAPEANARSTGGEDVVVAVIDDGVDFGHPDLAGHAWVNEGEIPGNNTDDDGNGYIDDVNGYDFANDDNTVHDVAEDFHGTHVAGTIAASSDGQNVVGVAPNVEIMAVKFLGGPFTAESTAIKAIEYAAENGAKISNNSWGFEAPPLSGPDPLKQAIERSGMLFVASAGNGGFNGVGDNNDTSKWERAYPASYDSPNILSVAAANNTGRLARFSNYGPKSVDVTAPGVDVLSTVPSVPAEPGAALSSFPEEIAELDGSYRPEAVPAAQGNALVTGFGIDEISGAQARAEFMSDALDSVGYAAGACDPPQEFCPTPEQVVLVDDDLSSEFGRFGVPDVTPVLSEAIQEHTGVAPRVIEVGPGDGPTFSEIEGKTVVWATGWAYFSGGRRSDEVKNTLTFADRNNLARLLDGGGDLILTGMDALFDIEDSAFVTDALGLEVRGDYYTGVFEGAAGTNFAGESYTLDNQPFAIPFLHDVVRPAGTGASTLGDITTPAGYEEYFSGTSMSAPHTTGVAALAAGEFPGLLNRPGALKRLVMGTGEPAPLTKGKTVTGDMANARKAVTDTAPRISNVSPTGTSKGTPRIRANVVDLQGLIPKKDVQLFVDGNRRMTFSYNSRSGALSLTNSPTREGRHTVRTTATDAQGVTATKRWSYRIN